MPRASRRRILLLAWSALSLAVILWLGNELLHTIRERGRATPRGTTEPVWVRDAQYVEDPVVGWRPKPDLTVDFWIKSIDGERSARMERHHDARGFIQPSHDRGAIGEPSALFLGDSHMLGVVGNDENASALLQAALRTRPGLERATVANAASGYYSLYQYVLRARTLSDVVRPRLVVAVVFLGNDVYELEDRGRPHLDDAMREAEAGAPSDARETMVRIDALDLPKRHADLVNQGLNQASYFASHPERFDAVLAKAKRCFELLDAEARRTEGRLLVALLPSYDLVYPGTVRALGAGAAAAVDSGVNARIHRSMGRILADLGTPHVDLLPFFLPTKDRYLYASDYHVWKEGHALLAEALAPKAAELLADAGK